MSGRCGIIKEKRQRGNKFETVDRNVPKNMRCVSFRGTGDMCDCGDDTGALDYGIVFIAHSGTGKGNGFVVDTSGRAKSRWLLCSKKTENRLENM